jgi:hypothetical protein
MWLKLLLSGNSALCELTQEKVFANQEWPNDMSDTGSIGSPGFGEWPWEKGDSRDPAS